MNKVAKYVIAAILLSIVAYGGWLVVNATFPLEVWFQENPEWRTIFNLLVVIGVIGVIAGIIEAKTK